MTRSEYGRSPDVLTAHIGQALQMGATAVSLSVHSMPGYDFFTANAHCGAVCTGSGPQPDLQKAVDIATDKLRAEMYVRLAYATEHFAGAQLWTEEAQQ